MAIKKLYLCKYVGTYFNLEDDNSLAQSDVTNAICMVMLLFILRTNWWSVDISYFFSKTMTIFAIKIYMKDSNILSDDLCQN
jgi:hypothetical protein